MQLTNLEQMHRFALYALKSTYCPRHIDTVEKAIMVLEVGKEHGLPPWVALSKIAVINGAMSIFGEAALGLCQSSSQWEEAGHKEWFDLEGDNWAAYCQVQRKGGEPHVASYCIQDAKTAKLWNKKTSNGKDTPWITSPTDMLMWRARHRALKAKFSDVLMGLAIREVAQDYIDVSHAPSRPSPVVPALSASDSVDAALADLPAQPEPAEVA